MILQYFVLLVISINYAVARMDMCRSKPPVMKDFDILKLKGRWYEYAHLPNIFQYFNKERCNTIDMQEARESIDFKMSFINETSEMRVHLKGNMTTTPEKPGKVLVNLFDLGLSDYFTIVDAKYDDYVIFYFCDTLLYFKVELAWVLTRQPILTEEKETLLMDRLWFLNIDVDRLEFENQTNCSGNKNAIKMLKRKYFDNYL